MIDLTSVELVEVVGGRKKNGQGEPEAKGEHMADAVVVTNLSLESMNGRVVSNKKFSLCAMSTR